MTQRGDGRPVEEHQSPEAVQDILAADRSRLRKGLFWFLVFSIFSTLSVLVIVLSVGVSMLRHTNYLLDGMDWLEGQLASQSLQIGEISNRVSQLTRAQLDVSSQVNRLQLKHQQSMDPLRTELDVQGRWIRTREEQIARERRSSDRRWNERGIVLDRVVAAVERLEARADELLVLDNGTVVDTADAEAVDIEGGSASTPLNPAGQRPAWSQLLDSFEGASLPEVMDEVVKHVDAGVPDPAMPRTISVVQFPNGDRYEGTFESGLMHGWGIYTYRDGDRYEGEFHHDVKHGNGILTLQDGTRYTGGFVRGIRHGLASLTRADGTRYAGEFANDMINGRGIMMYVDGGQYGGEFLNGLRHGHGTQRFANGDIYKGEYRQDIRTGRGLYVFADGSSYEGTFVEGVRHGQGRYRFTGGAEYIGGFRNGKMHGEGVWMEGDRRVRGLWHEGDHVRDLAD